MRPYQIDIKDVCKNFNTDLSSGLTSKESEKRFREHGPNRIKEDKKISPLIILLQQFLSPLMYILLIATIASLFIGEIKDAIVISIAVIINVVIGFIQEMKAAKAAQALKAYEVHHSQVRRDGKIISIESKKLVPGDIVILAAGSRMPADIRLSYAVDFNVEEAILTGESKAVKKNTQTLSEAQQLTIGDRTNMTYSGTYAISGKAEGVVVATGNKTELGKIAQLITETKEDDTPLQSQIRKFSWFLGWLMLGVVGFVFVLGILKQFPIKDLILMSIALAVAAVPEGLLVAVTVVLAIGMQKMLKRRALVRHLIAAETLGSVSIICTDKTGTLTKGFMAVEKIYTRNVPEHELLLAAVLNNDAQVNKERIGNPTEIALLEAAQSRGIDFLKLRNEHPRTDEIPFSSDKKYMATVHTIGRTTPDDSTQRLIVKGAPEKIFAMCSLDENTRKDFYQKASELTGEGLRVLALCYKDQDSLVGNLENNLNNLTLLGLVGLQDPLREHAADTVSELARAGIRTILVTGDHKETARNIALGAGIPAQETTILTGEELDKMSDKDLYENIANIDLFARVDPKHKIRIVNAWKHRGESVAMIGDGVNDAPALKAANIGVALGSGSDVAHEISDMVLLDNNLSTISAAVRQGRIIFDNIRKIIVYLMADSFSEIVLILGALILGLPMPILATQIFWINLVTDGFPDLALTVEPGEPEIMSEPPRAKNEPIMNKQMKILIFIIGIVTDLGLFALYFGLLRTNWDLIHIRTIMFTALAIDSLFYVFSVRSIRSSLFRVNPFKNKWLNLAVCAGALVQLSVIYLPPLQKLFSTVALGAYEWGIILGLALIKLVGIEVTKELVR
jgi:Ca2+-transporting ATPase